MPRQTVDLNGNDWVLGMAPPGADPCAARWKELAQVREWLPATVPGDVRADLIRAGTLPDLAFGMGPERAQWVDNHCWWLVRRFHTPRTPRDRVHLVMHGIDYVSDTFLNGRHLGRHEGMFSPHIHDITHLLSDENELAVRIVGSNGLEYNRSSPWVKLLNHVEARFGGLPGRLPHRRDTLKCQMGFGWDFAPTLRTIGIWDDTNIVISEQVFVRQVAIRQQMMGNLAAVTVHLTVGTPERCSAQLRCSLTGATFEGGSSSAEQPIDIAAGSSQHTIGITVAQPRLWWPWDHGHPHLYRLTAEIWDGTRLLDSTTELIGLRTVDLDGMTLRINGQDLFARGANWVPADILPGIVTEADYRDLLMLARQANMNLLRVWGGGLREKQAFYSLCDRLGILVWQEFPFACAFLTRFPRSRQYLRLVESEVEAIVCSLRNHPSVVLWCGGNEFDPKRNTPLIASLTQTVAKADPTRPFLPASPGNGDSHNWRVWHQFQPPAEYRRDQATFASEFGLQAPPRADALRRFIAPRDMWPPGPSWRYHGAGLPKLRRYARPFLNGPEPTLDQFVEACQRAQAYGLQIAIEHYRRRKANGCGGVLVWQLNEPWPAVSWSLVDYFRQPKLAYESVRRLYTPVLISVDYPLRKLRAGDRLGAQVWVINDLPQALPGCQWEAVLWDGLGQPVHRQEHNVDVAAGSAEVVGAFDCWLPEGGGWELTCSLTQRGQVVAANEYNLTVHDGIQPTLGQRLRARLTDLVMHGWGHEATSASHRSKRVP